MLLKVPHSLILFASIGLHFPFHGQPVVSTDREICFGETLFIPQTGAVFLFQESKDRVRKNYCIAQLCCDRRMRGGSVLDWSLLLPLLQIGRAHV